MVQVIDRLRNLEGQRRVCSPAVDDDRQVGAQVLVDVSMAEELLILLALQQVTIRYLWCWDVVSARPAVQKKLAPSTWSKSADSGCTYHSIVAVVLGPLNGSRFDIHHSKWCRRPGVIERDGW